MQPCWMGGPRAGQGRQAILAAGCPPLRAGGPALRADSVSWRSGGRETKEALAEALSSTEATQRIHMGTGSSKEGAEPGPAGEGRGQ